MSKSAARGTRVKFLIVPLAPVGVLKVGPVDAHTVASHIYLLLVHPHVCSTPSLQVGNPVLHELVFGWGEAITKKHYIVKPAVAPDSSHILEKLGPGPSANDPGQPQAA